MEKEISPGVVSRPGVLGGRPVLRGRRIAVSQLVDQFVGGMTLAEIQADYQLRDDEIEILARYIAQRTVAKSQEA